MKTRGLACARMSTLQDTLWVVTLSVYGFGALAIVVAIGFLALVSGDDYVSAAFAWLSSQPEVASPDPTHPALPERPVHQGVPPKHLT